MKKIIIAVTIIFIWVLIFLYKTEEKAIILPEEIGLAQEGDTLIVIKSNEDTIVLGYNN
jgi:hypothetical protein